MFHPTDPTAFPHSEKAFHLYYDLNVAKNRPLRPLKTAQEMLQRGGLAAIIAFGSQDTRHDLLGGCHRCELVAEYYLVALEWVMRHEQISCTADLLELVWQMTQMLLEHKDHSGYQEQPWFSCITKALWNLAKQLKDESTESDYYLSSIPGQRVTDPYLEDTLIDHASPEEMLRRAIRITIYNCRTLLYQQQGQLTKAATYYRKCLAVRPPLSSETHLLLRQTALMALNNLIGQEEQFPKSRTSSFSSTSSVSSTCSHCGIEKKTMPVCAKCKSRTYCSRRCLKAHEEIHKSECTKLSKT